MDKKCYICDNDNKNLFDKIQSENNELFQLLNSKGGIFAVRDDNDFLIEADIYWHSIYNRYENYINNEYGIGEKHFDICTFCYYDKDGYEYDDFIKVKEIDKGLFSKKKVVTIDVEHIKKNKEKWKKRIETEWQEAIKLNSDLLETEKKRKEKLENDIASLLKNKGIKISVSDINAHLKFGDIDKIKDVCEEMYENGKIDFASNGRYFILSENNSKPKSRKTSVPKTDSVADEIKKFADLKDQGILTQKEFDAKKKELLGL